MWYVKSIGFIEEPVSANSLTMLRCSTCKGYLKQDFMILLNQTQFLVWNMMKSLITIFFSQKLFQNVVPSET